VEFDNRSEFVAIEAPAQIRYLHLEPIHRFVMTMDFAEAAPARTQLTWTMLMEHSAENLQLKPFIAIAHQENFDRLVGFLRSQRRPAS